MTHLLHGSFKELAHDDDEGLMGDGCRGRLADCSLNKPHLADESGRQFLWDLVTQIPLQSHEIMKTL